MRHDGYQILVTHHRYSGIRVLPHECLHRFLRYGIAARQLLLYGSGAFRLFDAWPTLSIMAMCHFGWRKTSPHINPPLSKSMSKSTLNTGQRQCGQCGGEHRGYTSLVPTATPARSLALAAQGRSVQRWDVFLRAREGVSFRTVARRTSEFRSCPDGNTWRHQDTRWDLHSTRQGPPPWR